MGKLVNLGPVFAENLPSRLSIILIVVYGGNGMQGAKYQCAVDLVWWQSGIDYG